MKNNSCYFLFATYLIVLFLALQREIRLEHEWLLMMEDSSLQTGLRIFGRPTAYMPPFYPYYLLITKLLFGFTDWVKVSVAIQSIVYYFSVSYLFKTFLDCSTRKALILFAFVAFFPPIFAGNIAVSSFSLSVSIFCLFFALLYRVYLSQKFAAKDIVYLALISIAGLYTRYEFVYIIILSGIVFLLLRKISARNFVAIMLFVFVSYLPWAARNYHAIGKFSYATSLSYNFAKGYNEKYNIFSTYNFPYSTESGENLGIDVLYKKFRTEKDIDEYLSAMNTRFVSEHPGLFIKLTIQKIGINALQLFPDYNGISRFGIYMWYSAFFVFFQVLVLWSLKILKENKQKYLFVFTLSLYLFFLIFYCIAPMPRYLLLFFPTLSVVIIKTLVESNIMSQNRGR